MRVPFYFWFPILVSGSMGFMALCLPPVSDQFMTLFGVGYGGLSFFLSAYYWTHAFVQVPAGLIVDRIGVVRSLYLCVCLSFLCALAPLAAPESLALAVFARLVLGICTGGIFLVTLTIVKSITPQDTLSRVQGAQGAAFSLGSMVPYLTLPLFGAYGWAACYLVCAVFCLLLGGGAFKLPAKARVETPASATIRETWEAFKVIAVNRDIWFIGCCHGLAFGSLTTIVGNWMPSILKDTRPGTGIEDWAVATSILLVCGTAGRILGGEVARKMDRGLLLGRAVLAIGLSCAWIAASNSPLTAMAGALVLAVLGGGAYAAVYTLAITKVDSAYIATSVGFLNMIGNTINMLLILVLGIVRELTGSFSSGLLAVGILALGFWAFSRGKAKSIDARTL